MDKSLNGMQGRSETAPANGPSHVSSEAFASHMQGKGRPASSFEPNKSLIYTTTKDIIHARHSTYFSDKDNTVFVDGDEWHRVFNYIQKIFDLQVKEQDGGDPALGSAPASLLQLIRPVWKKCSYIDEIKNITKYVSDAHVVVELFVKGGRGKTPVMTKSGLHMFLKRFLRTVLTEQQFKVCDIAEKYMAQFVAEDASCIVNAGANAASSAPMQQNGPPVQAPDPPLMQVLAVCALRMMCSCAT
jgi:hypothetical protein